MAQQIATSPSDSGDQWHVTLRFLGNLDRAQQALAGACLIALGGPAVLCVPDRCAILPSAQRPRVIALGLDSKGLLEHYARILRQSCKGAGLPGDDRRFTAHLSLARLRSAGRIEMPDLPAIEPLLLNEIALMRSKQLGGEGAIHGTRALVLFRPSLVEGTRHERLARILLDEPKPPIPARP